MRDDRGRVPGEPGYVAGRFYREPTATIEITPESKKALEDAERMISERKAEMGPHDRLFSAVMNLRTEHGDAIDPYSAQDLYDAIVATVNK